MIDFAVARIGDRRGAIGVQLYGRIGECGATFGVADFDVCEGCKAEKSGGGALGCLVGY